MAPQHSTAGVSLARATAPLMLIASLLLLAPTAIQGRKLLQSSAYSPITCDVGNVIFTQDAACPSNVANKGLWQSAFQHTCPFPLTALTVQLSFGPGGAQELLGNSLIYGLNGCSLNADNTAATCQVSSSTQFSNGTFLGSLPLQEGASYAVWYENAAHPCGSTNNAPLWLTPVAATFDMPSPVTYEIARNTDIANNNILAYGIPSTFDTENIGTVSDACYNEGTLRAGGAACMAACDSWTAQSVLQPEIGAPRCEGVVYVPQNSGVSNLPYTCCFLKSGTAPSPGAPGIEAYKKI